jgi:hypothetical protein
MAVDGEAMGAAATGWQKKVLIATSGGCIRSASDEARS